MVTGGDNRRWPSRDSEWGIKCGQDDLGAKSPVGAVGYLAAPRHGSADLDAAYARMINDADGLSVHEGVIVRECSCRSMPDSGLLWPPSPAVASMCCSTISHLTGPPINGGVMLSKG